MNKIPPEKILNELENVLKFYSFKNSILLSNFLRYIVNETVDQRQHFIKEYSIAVNALCRPSNFDPHDDAVVRIHAGRLRKLLNEYYLSEGKNDQIVIHVPKGCYIPEFNYKEKIITLHHPNTQANPVIAIFPFKSISQNQNLDVFSLILSQEISAELSCFHDISVIGHFSSAMMSKINENTLEAANLIGADYVITGYIRSVDEELQIRINLLNSSTGKLLMTKLFNHEIIDDDIKIQNEIVKDIVCNIGGYYGAVFQEIIKTSSSISSNTSILKGISSYYQYQSSFSLDNFTNALTNLKEAYNQHPNHAVIMAMMGEFHLISIVLGLEENDSAIESANYYITKALKIDPLCQQALYSLTLINCFKNNSMGCLEAAEQCIKINPNSSIIILGLGCMLIFAGHYEKGFSLLENPIKTNNNHPWWVPIGYWYYFIHKKDYKNAFYWAGKIDNAQTIWDPLLKATSLSLLNEDYKAKKYLEKVLEIQPQLPKDIKKTLFSFMLSEDIILRITGSLTKIGCLIN